MSFKHSSPESNMYASIWRVFTYGAVRGVYYEIYDNQRFQILAYVLLRSITNEREDILKFFLFINIYSGENAFYDLLFFINIHLQISRYK